MLCVALQAWKFFHIGESPQALSYTIVRIWISKNLFGEQCVSTFQNFKCMLWDRSTIYLKSHILPIFACPWKNHCIDPSKKSPFILQDFTCDLHLKCNTLTSLQNPPWDYSPSLNVCSGVELNLFFIWKSKSRVGGLLTHPIFPQHVSLPFISLSFVVTVRLQERILRRGNRGNPQWLIELSPRVHVSYLQTLENT